jgi:hypothetical protein
MTNVDARAGERQFEARRVTGRTVSQTPGRLRVRLEREHRNQPELMTRIREHMSAVSGVKSVETNASTGSILIHHDPDFISQSTLHQMLSDLGIGLDENLMLGSEYSEIADKVIRVVDALDAWIKKVTGRTVDLRMLVPIGFTVGGIALAVVHGGLGIMDIPAFVFLWIGFDAFVQLHKSDAQPLALPHVRTSAA